MALHLVDRLGLSHNRIARMVLGTVFDVGDLGCYVAGAAVVWAVEATRDGFSRRGSHTG